MEQTIWAVIDWEGDLNCTASTKERADAIVNEGDNKGDFRTEEVQLYGEPPCWTALKQQVGKNLNTLYEDRIYEFSSGNVKSAKLKAKIDMLEGVLNVMQKLEEAL